ncbi:cell wall-binding repeat-containing protein [Lentibacillus saliphilus]|uniref:cell wall-binding repeat-containing protein n=1 Tax=Lentibacillus saliphilus TaxID=2737028 RepID=UPI001C2FB8A5|nr:cell wall-binding repeat-containing protein [Lentibacillus saliphilus]
MTFSQPLVKKVLYFATTYILAMLMLASHHSYAEDKTEFFFKQGTHDKQLTEDKTVAVSNASPNSKLSIKQSGREVFAKHLQLVHVTHIKTMVIDTQEYAVVVYRHSGSSNAIQFDVLKLTKSGVELLYSSSAYERAQIDLDNRIISIKYPEYASNDAMTEPSKLVSQDFTITHDGIQIGKEVTEPAKIAQPHFRNQLMSINEDNPTYSEVNRILTEEAIKAGISPEILKAIASQESSWEQYWTTVPEPIKRCEKDENRGTLAYDGTKVKLGYDCIGVGIMQISNHMYMTEGPEKEAYIDRLKTDMRFNIQEGIKILKQKWNYGQTGLIPTVNDNDPMVIENWYFAIMAYNGLLPRNNPLEKPYDAYQERVFKRMKDYSLIDLTPFPTHTLNPYVREDGILLFENDNVTINGPVHLSSQSLKTGDTAYVTVNGLRLRNGPGGDVVGSIAKGTQVTVTGQYAGNNSRTSQYLWFPIQTDDGRTGWVASSYLDRNDYIKSYSLEGKTRYNTAVSVANHGWHMDQPDSIIIGRGDLPIDSLTGSVLASSFTSPLLLTQKDKLTASTAKEIARLHPGNIFLLGGEKGAISADVELELEERFGQEANIIRIAGKTRYETAYHIAEKVMEKSKAKEIFITTGDETSSDPLAIAPYAGENKTPILLTRKDKLNDHIKTFIRDHNISKATIIGGARPVSEAVETELRSILGHNNVDRIKGATRYETNMAIVDKYYNLQDTSNLLIAQGLNTIDALAGAPYASKLMSPIILTRTNSVPTEIEQLLINKVKAKPNLYFLGGSMAIADDTRRQFIRLVE